MCIIDSIYHALCHFNVHFIATSWRYCYDKSIQLHELFGRFNYNISMKSGGVTIITGPNGFGKSTILRMINALNSENIEFFMELDFSKIMIVFDNEKKAFIQKTGKNLSVNNASIPLLDKDQLRFSSADHRHNNVIRPV